MARKAPRIRLDQLVIARELAPDLKQARALIMAGRVLVDDRPATKAGSAVRVDVAVRLKGETKAFVSRGGRKLDGALERFALDVRGRVALDIGSSTGGFTDCLLQRGAKHVHAVDVGYGLLAWSLRIDPRVTCLERTHIRDVRADQLIAPVEVVVADVSFISLRKVLPSVTPLMAAGAEVLLMIKPQFEAARDDVEEGGVVLNPEVRGAAIAGVIERAVSLGLVSIDGADSVLPGPSGNVEYFAWCRWPG